MKKIISVFLALCMITVVFTGCSDKKEKESSNFSIGMEDMPYGATLRDDKTNYKLRIQYDKRFLNDQQVKIITDYYYAVKDKDTDLYSSVVFPYFENYIKKYSTDGSGDIQTVIEAYNSAMVSAVGEDFEITLCDITDVSTESIESGLDTIIEKLDTISNEIDQTKVSDKITASYVVTADIYLHSGDNSKTISNDKIYLIEMDGQTYIML